MFASRVSLRPDTLAATSDCLSASTVPVSVTEAEVAGVPTVTASEPDLFPVVVGVKVSVTAQLAPAASVAPQLFDATAN